MNQTKKQAYAPPVRFSYFKDDYADLPHAETIPESEIHEAPLLDLEVLRSNFRYWKGFPCKKDSNFELMHRVLFTESANGTMVVFCLEVKTTDLKEKF